MSKMGLYIGNTALTDEDDDYFINLLFKDLRQIYTLDADLFDVVVLDNCLQKLENFYSLFEVVKRILKSESEFILILPDFRLYEKCTWPSRLNSSHLHSFSINLDKEQIPRDNHWQIEENLIPMLEQFGYVDFQIKLDDNNFDYDKPVLEDQTKTGASCFIMLTCKIMK